MTEQFNGFGIKGYRSFFGEMQYIGPLKKINLLAGQNSVGKSNVIRFLCEHVKDAERWRPVDLDRPRGAGDGAPFGYALCLPSDSEIFSGPTFSTNPSLRGALETILRSPGFCAPGGIEGRWLRYETAAPGGAPNLDTRQLQAVFESDPRHPQLLNALSSGLVGLSRGGQLDDTRRVLQWLRSRISFPQTCYIGAFRRIGLPGSEIRDGEAGSGLIESIAKLQNPEAMEQEWAEEKYAALNRFVADVFDEPGAQLEVPHSRKTINVRTRRNVLPLEYQGTGIHQVIIIATLATSHDDTLFCIEEPEVNLHPILQRRLLSYLIDETTNRYVIATHSAQMLDHERANVLHLTLTESGTQITPATSSAQVASICHDLGYRPSDLLQSNAVIWVEGPSDRIYIKHWISLLKPTLREGIEFSIMFYGGSLLRELSADDPAVGDFINLRRLNRNMAIVIDSDKRSEGAELNPTKVRVIGELARSAENGMCWVTDGYTIENYVPMDILKAAVASAHPRTSFDPEEGLWVNPLGSIGKPDKVRISREVVKQQAAIVEPALRKKIEGLISFIEKANSGRIADVAG